VLATMKRGDEALSALLLQFFKKFKRFITATSYLAFNASSHYFFKELHRRYFLK
jgi:hypothetical protein